ncbi:MAG: hypothetical protein M9919_15215 [Burkholderiaceae bacterium]|nr:hypothetical protein [Burkholderiaceae bacterium]
MPASRYTLRVSVKTLGKEPISGLDSEPSIAIGLIRVTVKQRERHLVLQACDFDSEGDAEDFLQQIKGGLWNLALEHNIAFVPYFGRRDLTRAKDPEAAAHNLAKCFGTPAEEPVKPVHGLTEEAGYTIFASDENIRFLAVGDFTAHASTGWDAVARTLTEGIQQSGLGADQQDSGLATAVDLYLTHFYETSIRARFLTLMMVLEVLAPVTERHPTAVQLLADFQKSIDLQIDGAADTETRDALEALRREIDFRKETSIRRRVRRLVLDVAPLDEQSRQALAKKVVDAYDLRGTVVHTGAVDAQALSEANETALQTAKLILRARLGLSASSSALAASCHAPPR